MKKLTLLFCLASASCFAQPNRVPGAVSVTKLGVSSNEIVQIIDGNAISKLGGLGTNTSFSGTTNYIGSFNFFQKFIPTGDAISGNSPWQFSQSIGPYNATNHGNIWLWGMNIGATGSVVDTNYHAFSWTLEQNYDPSYPSNRKQVEHYMTFSPRSNAVARRVWGWTLEDEQIDHNEYARYIWWAHPDAVNIPSVEIFTYSNNLLGAATLGVKGPISSTSNPVHGPGRFTATGSASAGAQVLVGNAGATKTFYIYGDGNDAGLPNENILWSEMNDLRLIAVQRVRVVPNLLANSNVISGGIFHGNGSGLTNIPQSAISNSTWDTIITKSADQSVTNSSTPVADTELTSTLLANGFYQVELLLRYSGNDTTGDYRCDFALPSCIGSVVGEFRGPNGSFVATNFTYFEASTILWPSTDIILGTDSEPSGIRPVWISFMCTVGSTNGPLTFKFANSAASSGRISTTKAGSTLRIKKLF